MAVQLTWVQVARRKKTPAFLPTECAVNLEEFAAPQRIPPSSSRYSAFIPLPAAYKKDWALEIVSQLPNNTVGIVPRTDIFLLEVCFVTVRRSRTFCLLPSSASTSHLTLSHQLVLHLVLCLLSW